VTDSLYRQNTHPQQPRLPMQCFMRVRHIVQAGPWQKRGSSYVMGTYD